MPSFESFWGQTTTDDVANFEARTGISLPESYRRFLLEHNGGRPLPQEFDIPGSGDAALADLLYGIRSARQPGDLEAEYETHRDELAAGFLPIGHDPGANVLLLATAGEHRGRVLYWDSSLFFESSDEDHNTYPIADSFDDFLASLK